MYKIFLILFLIFPNFTIGQSSLNRFIPLLNKSGYVISRDSTMISFPLADSIAVKMDLNIIKLSSIQHLYFNKSMWFPYKLCFSDCTIKSHKTISYKGANYSLNSGDHIFGFTTSGGTSGFAARNVNKFFMSAYFQEIDKSYKSNHYFFDLPSKEEKNFRKRNWISMGYATSYAVKDNPFIDGKGILVGFAYLLDALHYHYIFSGPILGGTSKEKIEIPVLGIASLIIWRKLILGKKGIYIIKSYNKMVNSKYGIPNNLERLKR